MRSILNGSSDIFPRNDKSILDTSSSSRYKKSSPNDLLSLLLRLRQMSRLTSAHQSAGLYEWRDGGFRFSVLIFFWFDQYERWVCVVVLYDFQQQVSTSALMIRFWSNYFFYSSSSFFFVLLALLFYSLCRSFPSTLFRWCTSVAVYLHWFSGPWWRANGASQELNGRH